jgi:hypothetical protein
VHQCKLVCCFVLGNSNVSCNKICGVSKCDESDKSADLNTTCTSASTGKETVTPCLNTEEELPEHEEFIHIPTECAQSFVDDVAFQSILEVHNVEHHVLEKSNIPFPPDQRNELPQPTSQTHDTSDLNVFNVELSGNSTYDDIVSILNVLEQEEICSREF